MKAFASVLAAACVLAVATVGCTGDVVADPTSIIGKGAIDLPDLGVAEATTGADDSASLALAAIRSFDIVGTRVSRSFHSDGIVSIVAVPRDVTDKPLLDTRIFLKVTARASVPFPMSAQVRVAGTKTPAPQPFQMAVSIDSSGSMSSSDPGRVRVPAANGFVDLVSARFSGSEFAVWDFDTEVRALAPFSPDPASAKAATAQVREAGSTALHKGAMAALDALVLARKPGWQQGLLVLTDGMDNSSEPVTAKDVIAKAKGAQIPIYTLGLGGALDIPGLSFVGDIQEYAAETGGTFAYARDASRLTRAFDLMAASATSGSVEVEVDLSGGTYVPFSTVTIEVEARAGGASAKDSFELVVPLS